MGAPSRRGLRKLAGLASLVLAAFCVGAGPAGAAPPLVRIDRIEVEPSLFEGLARLQIFVTAVDLHGVFRDDLTGERAWKLRIGNRPLRAPYLLGTFRHVDDELLVAVVVETAAPLADALPEIQTQLESFLAALPRTTRVVILGYDDDVEGGRRPADIARVRQAINGLDVNAGSTEFKLIEAVNQAREALARTRPETPGVAQRKIIIVISDGKDVDPTPANYRAVSKRAGTQGIRIHTLGFPADRNRHPLYGLAEMSKQSGGTFRLVLTKSGFAGHFEQLAREINDQYVLTYFVPEDQIARKRIQVEARDIVSESARVPRTTCGGETCAAGELCAALRCMAPPQHTGLGFMGWLLVVAGVLVGLVVVVGLLGVLLGWLHQRRRRQGEAGAEGGPEAGAPDGASGGAPAEGAAPAEPVVQRVIPQGLHGQPVPPTQGRAPAHGVAGTGKHAPVAGTGKHAPVAGTGKHAPVAGHPGAPEHAAAAVPGPSAVHRVLPTGGPSGAMPAMAAPSLLILTGIHAGKRVPLHHGFVIGTAAGSHLLISDDRFASSHHAHVLMDTAGGCTLVDRASTNGTFINGVRMREQRLVHGMLIKVGSTEARFLSQ
jgi:Inner membrane component of T3SS, cytoplasmic domain/von Willebrand factor type A domain